MRLKRETQGAFCVLNANAKSQTRKSMKINVICTVPVFLWPGITSKFGLSQHKRTVHDGIVLVCDVKGCLLTGSAKEQIKAHKDQHTTC